MSAICIRLDDEVKTQLDCFCDSVGLTVSAVFTLFAKKVVNEGRIPFEISAPRVNPATIAAMEEGERLAQNGEDGYRDLEKLWADLER